MAKRPDLAERNMARATHRMTNTPTYKTWDSLRQRCTNPNCKDYARYGARGITVCERWMHSFEAFLADMGERPAGMSIERINNDLGYMKDNCIWATAVTQSRNRRSNVVIEYDGESGPISFWAERMGIERKTLEYRIRVGWDVKKALTTPSIIPRKRKQ